MQIKDGMKLEPLGDALGPRRQRRALRSAGCAVLVAAVGLTVGATSAWAASTSPAAVTQTVAAKARFSGTYKWYSKEDNRGGFQIGGTLSDLNKSNARGVKFQVKVLSYAPNVYNAPTDRDLTIPQLVHFAGGSTITSRVQHQTCQRNTIFPDNCTVWVTKANPYYVP